MRLIDFSIEYGVMSMEKFKCKIKFKRECRWVIVIKSLIGIYCEKIKDAVRRTPMEKQVQHKERKKE
jgi:hypothetical protein